MNVLVRFGPVLILFSSTLFLALFWLISIGKTTALQPGTCRKRPSVFVTDHQNAHSLVLDALNKSTKRIQFSVLDPNLSMFRDHYLHQLHLAHSRGVTVEIIASLSDTEQEILKELNITNVYLLNNAYSIFASQTVVVDDSAFIVRALVSEPDTRQLDLRPTTVIQFVDCQAGVDDIVHFVEHFKKRDSKTLDRVIPSSLSAVTSAISPVSVDGSQFYLFHTPSWYVSPLRISAEEVLVDMIDSNPAEMKFYASFPPAMDSNTGPGSSRFQFYLQLKKGWLMNKTRVKYLVSSDVNQTENRMWCNAMAAFKNVELRLYDKKHEGIDFILADGYSYVMTNTLKAFELNHYVALHLATNDRTTWDTLSERFDRVWNESAPFTPEMPDIV